MALIRNKKAEFNYEILERYRAGIELFGFEVKSIRKKDGNLEGSYVVVRGGEAYLVNAHIPSYQPSNTPDTYDPERPRRLLLERKEILELEEKESKKGLTIVPISMYDKKGLIKVEVAVARGKKKADKREAIKERDTKRDIERELKDRYNT